MKRTLLTLGLVLAVGCGGGYRPPPGSTGEAQVPSVDLETSPASPAGPRRVSLEGAQAVVANAAAAADKAAADPIGYAWDLFIALNWPAKEGVRGEADPDEPFGASGLVVWQTWKPTEEVFLPGGARPESWDSGDIGAAPRLASVQIDGEVLKDKQGRDVEYGIRMNRSTFDYIVRRQLYSYQGQSALLAGTSKPVEFEADAMEIKSAWRMLDPDDDLDRYLTRKVLFQTDGGGTVEVLAGLTGLHIISKAIDGWFWCTFEQVDNDKTTDTRLKLPIPRDVQESNREMQQRFAGTRWQYYRLDGTQTEFVDNTGQPILRANSQLETNFQESSSCKTCHFLASVGPPANPRFSVFKLGPTGQQGYVGEPPRAPFESGGDFKQLDYVWSLQRAR